MAFFLELTCLIKDPIYGYVELSELERRVIETSIFQRLRFITQNGLSFFTYPALRGTRFEHSIGACHLAGRVMASLIEHSAETVLREFLIGFCSDLRVILPPGTYRKLMDHCKTDLSRLEKLNRCELAEIANFMVQVVRLLALLHDIGHLPFSHLGEDALEPFTKELLGDEEYKEFQGYESRGGKLHEYFGYKIITVPVGDLKSAFKDAEGDFYFVVLQEVYRNKKRLEGRNVLRALCELVDSDIDVDRGDYLRRDGYNSGIGFGHYDIDRLLDSIRIDIVEHGQEKHFLIAPTDASISPVEDFLLERYKLHKWLYFHHSIKYFNACLVKALESIIRLKPYLSNLYMEKFQLAYFHYTRYAYRDGFLCNEIWLWDVFYKAYIDLRALEDPAPEVRQAIVYLDVVVNRAKRGFSIWKTIPQYLEFNKKLKGLLCQPRPSHSAGAQYFRLIKEEQDLKDIKESQFFNTILRKLLIDAGEDIKRSFFEKFYKTGIAVRYDQIKALLALGVSDQTVVGHVFLSVNKFEPFRESKRLSTKDNVVSQIEFLIRKPEDSKKLIRLTDVSRLIRSMFEVWRADIQCYLYFVVASIDYSELAQKEKRGALVELARELFCKEVAKWLEEQKLISVES